jgi:hypothetical protein
VSSRTPDPWRWDRYTVPKRRYRTTTRRCVISQKSADLIKIAAKAWNQSYSSVFLSPSLLYLLVHNRCRGFFSFNLIILKHTPQSVGLLWTSDQPVAETSTWQHKHSQETNIHVPGEIRTHDPSKRSAADLRKIKIIYVHKLHGRCRILSDVRFYERTCLLQSTSNMEAYTWPGKAGG